MDRTAICPRPAPHPAGVWRHPPRPASSRDGIARDLVAMIATSAGAAIVTGLLAAIIMMSGPTRAAVADDPGDTVAVSDTGAVVRPIARPGTLSDTPLPPVCTCILPPAGDD